MARDRYRPTNGKVPGTVSKINVLYIFLEALEVKVEEDF